MRESSFRRQVCRILRDAGLDPVAVENSVHPGTPDVNYLHGWIELKVARPPRRAGSPIAVPSFTPQQRVWLRRRWDAGGEAWLLLRVGSTHFLLDGRTAADRLGKMSVDQLHASSCSHYSSSGQLIGHLCWDLRMGRVDSVRDRAYDHGGGSTRP